jgi:hypothetical protein
MPSKPLADKTPKALTTTKAGSPADITKRKRALQQRNGSRTPKVSDLMEQIAWERADELLKPYLDALELEPDPAWSTRTKLEFLQSQTNIVEKLLNRVEGMPVARQRNVDANDNDILPHLADLPGPVIEKLILEALAGKGDKPETVEAEAVEVD